MAERKFLKIDSVNNSDGNSLFNAICEKVLDVKPQDAKELLGIPKKEDATTQDVITLLQNSIVDGIPIDIDITIKYTPNIDIEEEFGPKQ